MAQLVGFDPCLPTPKKVQFNAIDFNMLSKKALREIIGILIQEVERLSRPKGNFAIKQKTGKVQRSQMKVETSEDDKIYENRRPSVKETSKMHRSKTFSKKISSEIKTTKICWYFNNSTCKFGRECRNLHAGEKRDNEKQLNGKLTLEQSKSISSDKVKESYADVARSSSKMLSPADT